MECPRIGKSIETEFSFGVAGARGRGGIVTADGTWGFFLGT